MRKKNIFAILKVLHITSWFPNAENPNEALWIKRHIDSLSTYADNYVWHIRTMENRKWSTKFVSKKSSLVWVIAIPTRRWFLIELVTFFQLFWLAVLKRKFIQNCDIINFHIAYPALVFWNLLRPFFGKTVIITEHWSAYHYNFGVSKPLPRIQKIFRHSVPVIAVSQALINDLKLFSRADFESFVVPNVVDTTVFKIRDEVRRKPLQFFMVSQWKFPKDPYAVIEAFARFCKRQKDAQLRIGGYGPQMQQMQALVTTLGVQQSVLFLGSLNSGEIAKEMNEATAFIHISGYETFSVVCAEAICCGCPVVVSNVGGVSEFINNSNGVLVASGTFDDVLFDLISTSSFNHSEISRTAHSAFNLKYVGSQYFQILSRFSGKRLK